MIVNLYRDTRTCLLFGIFLCTVTLASLPALRSFCFSFFATSAQPIENQPADNPGTKRATALAILQTRCEYARARLRAKTPRGPYLVVSISDNRFSLYRDKTLTREGMCSTGSLVLLKSRDGTQEWLFETPRGMLNVLEKEEDPVWVMPDWAFIEEGRPVPEHSGQRVQHGVLGDYSLALGNGYLIHGTLYQRLLGLPATHGCIRLGDEDLEVVYNTLPTGAQVFLY